MNSIKVKSPLNCWKGYERVPGSKPGAKGSCRKSSPVKKKMGDFKHSDAPDAKGKFKTMSPSNLASWLIKTRKGNLSKIISSLNQQVVFNRGKNPSYASKMKTTMNIVRKRLGKDSPTKMRDKQYRGVLKARISKLYGGDVTVDKAKRLKARPDATPRDKQLANWFINMQTNRPSPAKRKDPLVGTGKKPKGSGRRLYTDENPKDTVGIKFATVGDARKTIAKVKKINKPYARKVQILTVLEQRAKVMGKMEQARLAKQAKLQLKKQKENAV